MYPKKTLTPAEQDLLSSIEKTGKDNALALEKGIEFFSDSSPRIVTKRKEYKKDSNQFIRVGCKYESVILNDKAHPWKLSSENAAYSLDDLHEVLQSSKGKLIRINGNTAIKFQDFQSEIKETSEKEGIYKNDAGLEFLLMDQNKGVFTPLKKITDKQVIDLETELIARNISQQDIINAITSHITNPHIDGKKFATQADGIVRDVTGILDGEDGDS